MKKDSLYLTERQHQAKRLLRDGDYKSIRDMLGRLKDQLPKQPILAELDEKKEIYRCKYCDEKNHEKF